MFTVKEGLLIIISAYILDLIFGDPAGMPHPITVIGKVISFYEKQIRKRMKNLWIGGFVLIFLSLTTVLLFITVILYTAGTISSYFKIITAIYIAYTSLAAKCLSNSAKQVYIALSNNNIKDAREKISMLVARNTEELDRDEIIRASVETVAENTVDGVTAPLIYLIIGVFIGIPVHIAFIYKTVNTLDSMVGYIQKPYKEIGFASAKTDDLLNFIPARISGIIMVLTGIFCNGDIRNGFKILIRDRLNHKSPNCGYPEAAVAGLYGIQLGGTNTYFGQKMYKPTIGDKINNLKPQNILDSIKVMYASEFLLFLIFVFIYILI